MADLRELIDAHRAAVVADEATFDDDGNSLDVLASEATASVELAAFRDLVAAPCRSHEEVQAKIGYLLNGTVGMRDTLINCLIDYGDDVLPNLLASLLIDGGTK